MNHSDEFVELITACQGRLFSYIAAALGSTDLANEVLQETNLVLWRKSDDFELGTNFDAWAYRVASFQVMAFRQRRMRDKLFFDHSLVEKIMTRSESRSDSYESKIKQLYSCLEQLPERSREVIRRRYSQGESLQEIADGLEQNQNAIGQLIFRIKKKLIDCVSLKYKKVNLDAT